MKTAKQKKKRKNLKFKQSLINPNSTKNLSPLPFPKLMNSLDSICTQRQKDIEWLQLYKNNSSKYPLKRSLIKSDSEDFLTNSLSSKQISIKTQANFYLKTEENSTKTLNKNKNTVFSEIVFDRHFSCENNKKFLNTGYSTTRTRNFSGKKLNSTPELLKSKNHVFDSSVIPEKQKSLIYANDFLCYMNATARIPFR